MKPSKIKVTARNPLVRLAMFRKAGSHRKTNKALRRQEKSRGYGEMVSQRTFNPPISGSNPGAPTMIFC